MALSLKKKKDGDASKVAKPAPARPARMRKGNTSLGDNLKKPGKGAKRFVLIIGDEGGILIFMHGSRVMRRLFAPSAQPSR